MIRVFRSARSGAGRQAGPGAKLVRTLFGLAFAAIPLFGGSMMLRAAAGAHGAAAWTETPCTIVESSSEAAGNGGWRLRVLYRYEAGGRTRESRRWTWDDEAEARVVEGIAKRDVLLARRAPGAALLPLAGNAH